MKKIFYILFFFLFSLPFWKGWGWAVTAQNLVPNPSFEDTVACPNGFSQVYNVKGWNSYRPTPDYFHTCSSSDEISVPNSLMGYQFPSSITCNAYCGLFTFIEGINYREFIGNTLLSPLIIGQKYYVSIKVSLAEDINCATNNLGVLFSTMSFNDSHPAPITNYAHIYTSSVISDTSDWTSISGSFIADSNYKYIILGNFFDNPSTDTALFNIMNCSSYYFIDDICVSSDSLTCNSDTICGVVNSLLNNNSNNIINIFPNPFNTLIEIDYKQEDYNNLSIELYNILGQKQEILISFDNNRSIKAYLKNKNTDNGIYYLKMITDKKIITKKLIHFNY